ncbi:diacylglycerol/lipid kinase family protein [Arthrobacter crystallopoietes]|nr:diacylglycerol kinase family protein [Arthrobacter crystallopoietes]AUI50725.1 diacylglycerol kinase [Arthrobacter crystallopoietes]
METQWMVGLVVVIAAVVFLVSWLSVRHLPARRAAALPGVPVEVLDARAQRVAVILNPVKNDADAAREKIRLACTAAGWPEPMVFETTIEDPGHTQTRRALEAGADVVLAGGGDGTVRVVTGELAGTTTPFGLVPLGTGNLLARNLGINPGQLDANILTALHGADRRIDTATITLENSVTGSSITESFLVIAGIGLDAQVLADTKDDLKRKYGWLAYSEAGVRNLPGKRKKVTISIDDGPAQTRSIRSILFANCGKLPAGIDFIPSATVDDGELDIVVMSPRNALGWIRIAAKTLLRHNARIPVIDYYRGRKVTVTAHEPMGTQLDGDLSGDVTSLTVQVRPSALSVRVDPQTLAEVGAAAGQDRRTA